MVLDLGVSPQDCAWGNWQRAVPGLTADSCSVAAELTAAHFGGGGPLHQKPAPQPGEDGERPKSRKELIEELIAKSKQEKVRWFRQRHGPRVLSRFPSLHIPGRVCSLL